MFTYILIFIMVSTTLFCLYMTNKLFEYNLAESRTKQEVNIISDCIVILSIQDCLYCNELMNRIAKTKSKYTVITMKQDATFKFDYTFANLPLEERNNIISEVKKIFKTGEISFPTILIKNKIHKGLPNETLLKEMFIV